MKQTSISEWKAGDRGITSDNVLVTVKRVGKRFIEIVEPLEKQLYIPAHGEIGKVTVINPGIVQGIDGKSYYNNMTIIAQ